MSKERDLAQKLLLLSVHFGHCLQDKTTIADNVSETLVGHDDLEHNARIVIPSIGTWSYFVVGQLEEIKLVWELHGN